MRTLLLTLGSVAAIGCTDPPIEFLEVQRPDEPLADSDIETLIRIASQLSDERLPSLPPHFLPPPQWDANRAATVATLAREELERLRESTRLSVLAGSNTRRPRLRYALEEEGLTDEQYASLLLAVGIAVQRSKVDPARDLAGYVEDGRRVLKRTADWNESYATLPPDVQVRALDEATWITRVDRAERLGQVPDANVSLVESRVAELANILPTEFLVDPLAEVADPLRDFGVPFRERADSGFDSELTWSRGDEQVLYGSPKRHPQATAGVPPNR